MKKNVGTIDAIMRITCGLTGLAWATSRMVRRPYRSMPMIMAALSAMKVAEGITRYCPMLDAFGVNSLSEKRIIKNIKKALPIKEKSSKAQQSSENDTTS